MDKFDNVISKIEEERLTINKVKFELSAALVNERIDKDRNVALLAYLASKASQVYDPSRVTFEALVNGGFDIQEEIRQLISERLTKETWENILAFINRYDSEMYKLTALKLIMDSEDKGTFSTPLSIIKLSNKLLNINAEDSVADIGCGNGNFSLAAALEENNARYFAYDINEYSVVMANIVFDLMDVVVEGNCCDVFSLVQNDHIRKFDKIFANYPFGLKVKSLGEGKEYFNVLTRQYPDISTTTSSDWIFNSLLCDLMKNNGKAVAVMTNGSTWNSIDTPIRKHFVERRLVETVISLPGRMFSNAAIPTTIIVLSKNNEKVRMIDATKLYQQGRRQNELSDENIETIIGALNTDSEFSRMVTLDELRENEYVLNLSRYFKETVDFENGVPFERVIKSITRGAQCTASQLDELVSDKETNMHYLMLGNIHNGLIDENLPCIAKIEEKQEKYCLKNNSLILSKNGYPYKVAVAKVCEGQRILANGNLYIIELDEEVANPYYIKAFLVSELGTTALKSITVGATIPNIGVDKLKKLIIPLPSMEEQDRIAGKYQSALDEVLELKQRLVLATEKLQHIFDVSDLG